MHFLKINTSSLNSNIIILLRLLLQAGLLLILFGNHLWAQATPATVGYRTYDFGGDVYGEPSAFKPESKLWWNDNTWWASMFNPSAEEYRIYRYNVNDMDWSSTATTIDDRHKTTADALWDEASGKLYIVSNYVEENDGGPADPGNEGRIYRYTYNSGNQSYSLDSGFPVNVNSSVSETLVLDKDSQGKLWVTWTELGKVMLNYSSDDGVTWGTPFILPIQGNDIQLDDISAVRYLGNGELGVMWSNQADKNLYFAVHQDTASPTNWGTLADRETALGNGSNSYADDHLNLNVACDGSGTLYAVSKTSRGSNDPLIMLNVRDANGVWTNHTVFLGLYESTRPTMMIDGDNETIYIFASNKENDQRGIYYKTSDLNNISFQSGIGTAFILSDDDDDIDNPTSTKQCINTQSGLLMLASCKDTDYYLHNYMELSANPIITDFTPDNGAEGISVTINGRNFTGTTEVSFNGTTAAFTVTADTVIATSVPVGASTGTISVTNANGTTISDSSFMVVSPPYILTTGTVGSGSISLNPPGGSYNSVTSVTVAATPASGYVFTGWSGDLSGNANPDSILMNGNRSVTAIFTSQSALAVTHEETQTGGSTATNSVTTSSNLTAAVDHLYIAAISTRQHDLASSVSGLGLSWTRLAEQCSGRLQTGVEIWTAQGVPSGNGTVTASFSTTVDNAVIAVSRYSGVASVSPLGSNAVHNSNGQDGSCSGGTDSSAFSINFNANAGGSIIYSAIAPRQKSFTPGSGYSELAEISQGESGDKIGIAIQEKSLVSEALTTVDGSFNGSTDWAVFALEIVGNPDSVTQFDLTTNISGMGSVQLSPAGGTYDSATVVTLTAVPDSGYTFDGWSGDLNGIANPDSVSMDSNIAITATFSEIPPTQFTVVINAIGNGNIVLSPAGGTYDSASVVTVTATADSGYIFTGWSGDLSGNANPDSITLNENKTINGTFIRQFALATNTVGMGSIQLSPAGGVYDTATVVTLTALPAEGYNFTGWSGGLTGSENPDSLTMSSDTSVTATFTEIPPVQYTVTTSVSGPGSVTLSPPGGTYDAGSEVVITAIPDSGYGLENWSGDLGGSENPDTIIVNDNMSIVANFIRQYSLTISNNGSGSVSLSPAGGIYDSASVVTLTPVPGSGYTFGSWAGDLAGTGNPETILMNGDKTVTANFTTAEAQSLTFEEVQTGDATEVLSVSTTGNLTAATDHLYLASVSTRMNIAVSSVSGLGLTWTLLQRQCAARSQTAVEIWEAIGTPSGDGPVTATFLSAPDHALIAVSRYSGVDAQDPVGTIRAGNTLGVDGSCTGGTDSNAYAFPLPPTVEVSRLFIATAPRNRDHTPHTGITERIEITIGDGGDKIGLAVSDSQLISLASAPISGTFSGDADWAAIGIEIKPAPVASAPLVVRTKVFLEGAFDNGKMNVDLRSSALLDSAHPYNASPWFYSGMDSSITLPDSAVDWVLVQLRSGTTAASEVGARAGLLRNDGVLLDTSGTAGLTFPGIPNGDYYITIYHRNHLSLMSSSSQSLSDSSVLYDFTSAQSQAYGSTPMSSLSGGVFGMIAGDSNGDGSIDATDKNTSWRMENGTVWGYSKWSDFNLNGGIDIEDLNLYWRKNNGMSTQVP